MTVNLEMIAPHEHDARAPYESQSTRTLGAFSLHANRAAMVSTIREGEFAFFYGPGWHTDGRTIAENFDKHVQHLGSTHYGVHSDERYTIDDQKEVWLKARKKDGYRPALIYAQSKGVLSVSHMFSDTGFMNDFGEVASVCYDAGTSSKRTIRPLPRAAMSFGVRLPGYPIVERSCAWLMDKALAKECAHDHGPEVACHEALSNSAASARTRLHACLSQLRYLWTHDIAQMDLAPFGSSVPNKVIISSKNDAVVDTDSAATVINNSYGGGFVHLIDDTRYERGHATGTEHPQGIVDALTGQHREKYTVRPIRGQLAQKAYWGSFLFRAGRTL